MQRWKVFLLRSGLYKLFLPFVPAFSKLVWFIRLAEWADRNRQVPFNDFPTRPDYYKRYDLYRYILKEHIRNEPVSYLEFGIGDGETCRWWLKEHTHAESRFYGFDTFEGLPEDWGAYKKGSFSNQGRLPDLGNPRASVYPGLFQETLYPFLRTFRNEHRNLLFLDADLYSSTLYVLATIAPYLKSGDILVFDEFFEPQHEFMAWVNFLQSFTMVKMRLTGATNNYSFTAFIVE